MINASIKLEFDFSGAFTDVDGKYYTCDSNCFDDNVDKVLSDFDCIAYITCPKGKIGVYLQPEIDADNFKCCELCGSDSRDFITLLEKEETNGFKTPYGEDVDFLRETVEYLYDKDIYYDGFYQEACWILKTEICDEIINIINEKLKKYIKGHGYEEIEDLENYDW